MKCGYCHALQQDEAQAPMRATAPKPSPLGVLEFFELVKKVPAWVWPLLAGQLAVVIGSFVADAFLPHDSLPRAIWSTAQLGAALLIMLAAQVWVLMLIAADEDHTLGATNVILPIKLWKCAYKHLPKTRKPVWLGGWCQAAIVASLFITGGFEHWLHYYRPKKYAQRDLLAAVIAAAAKNKGEEVPLEEVVEQMNKRANEMKEKLEKEKKKDDVDRRPTVECVILGYQLDEEQKVITGLVLGAARDGVLSYVGVVKRGFNERDTKEMLQRFENLKRPTPFIRAFNVEATWLKPEIFCEVHAGGFDTDGRLIAPNFRALLQPQK